MSELAAGFAGIREAMAACVDSSLRDCSQELGRIHQLDEDLRLWIDCIPDSTGEQLTRARSELAHAEHAAASGLYRQAFGSLRLFLELAFAAVYFSANEFERRRWLSDRTDFSWSKALDHETGVLARAFVQEFNGALVPITADYATSAAETYRYCSQFVHGKAAASWRLPETVEYSAPLLSSWCSHASAAGKSVFLLLLVRFGGQIAEPGLSPDLIDAITARFGNHQEVRDLIGHANA
jgi:hypothetical protein